MATAGKKAVKKKTSPAGKKAPAKKRPPVKASSQRSKKKAGKKRKAEEVRIALEKRTDEEKNLERRAFFDSILNRIPTKLTSFESLDKVLGGLVEISSQSIGAERCTIFLNDETTGELYSRVAQGQYTRTIRFINTAGIAGDVFQSGESAIIQEAYKDDRFNRDIDQQTGFTTDSMMCAPITTFAGERIGVTQVLNKLKGRFNEDDLALLKAITRHAAFFLQSTQHIEHINESLAKELKFIDVVTDITSEIDLPTLLCKIMGEATRMLDAERSTLFLNDDKTGELWSEVADGMGTSTIRFPNHLGIAGTVFSSGKTINIPHAYADLRFNPAFDKSTGFFTRSILCVPLVNKNGRIMGVTQVLNKKGGAFTHEDETRLRAFTAQVSIALENAQLFSDVQKMKNYNESMLESMSNGVVTLDEEGKIVTCNAAGLKIMGVAMDEIVGKQSTDFFTGPNEWVMEKLVKLKDTQTTDYLHDAELEFDGEKKSVNLTVMPLKSEEKSIGSMVVIEDVSSEKRMKSTMSRYMDPGLADRLLAGGEDLLGGNAVNATVLFSDIRGFTTITEELGPTGTVSLLNEYFTIMVDCIQREGGMLDKFIGDAIMAAFGLPIPKEDDEDRAVKASIAMIRELWEWNEKQLSMGKRAIDMGVGLNTDSVVAGNIGSPKRMDYTMIGDGVNLASRLESACKSYSARILISDNTYKSLQGTYRVRDVDDVIVKGKTEPVAIYEVLDYHTDSTFPNIMEACGYFNEGRKHYRKAEWDKAVQSFNKVLDINGEDELSKTYIGRCEELKTDPPPDGEWKGVWVMKTK